MRNPIQPAPRSLLGQDEDMDVLLIDDKEGEGAFLIREWEHHGIRVLHSDDLKDFDVMAEGGRPDGWPEGPYELGAAVIDLDLGNKGPGPAGGIVATDKLLRWQRNNRRSIAIALRTADVDDDRALAAVLAAELAERPLPLWGKSKGAAECLRSFVLASRDAIVDPALHGAQLVHPVWFIKEERGENLLGEYLYDGRRARVWERLWEGFDVEPAILAAGYKDHNKYWEQHRWLIAAILHLRDNGTGLHALGGSTLRLPDVQRDIYAEAIEDLEVAIYAVKSQDDIDDHTKEVIIHSLEKDKVEFQSWLDGQRKTRPSQKRNVEQGEFLGVFGRVLGHPEVVELFRH